MLSPEEKKMATITRRLDAIENRVNEMNKYAEYLTAEGQDYIARKITNEIRSYTASAYYADATDKFINVLESHKLTATPELVMKLLECASYTKWMAERQAGELAKEVEKTKRY